MLVYQPSQRITCKAALKHDYFRELSILAAESEAKALAAARSEQAAAHAAEAAA